MKVGLHVYDVYTAATPAGDQVGALQSSNEGTKSIHCCRPVARGSDRSDPPNPARSAF